MPPTVAGEGLMLRGAGAGTPPPVPEGLRANRPVLSAIDATFMGVSGDGGLVASEVMGGSRYYSLLGAFGRTDF